MSTITVNGQVLDLSTLDVDALLELKKAAQDARANQVAQQKAEMAVFLQDAVEAIVDGEAITQSDTSAWVGASFAGIPVTVDGKAYTASIRVTDTEATKAREHLFPKKAAKAEAK